jgi:hypothetical protein
MEMSLKVIGDSLVAKGLSPIACLLATRKQQQRLLIQLEYEQKPYLLELHSDYDGQFWTISEVEKFPSSAMSESSQRESASTK